MLRILVADDHAIVRRGVMQILREEFPTATIEEVSTAEDLLHLALTGDWDVVITDLAMPGRSGLEALKQIRLSKPAIPVLVLSMYPEEQYAIRVLKAGAAGYLNKEAAPDELVEAVRKVLTGRKYITAFVAAAMAHQSLDDDLPPHHLLSDREFEVMKQIAAGKAVSEIAEILHLGVTTVSTYRARILSKLQLKTNAALTLYVLENGI